MPIKLGVRWMDFQAPIDRGTVRAFISAAEDLGFDHVTCFDHMAGMNSKTRRGWRSDYRDDMEWAEALTLLSFMSGLSDRLGLMTGILGLPARPTFLVAKQAATIDRLSDGRLRLGIGIGHNDIEFNLLGQNFENRPERMEEQIKVLRELWTRTTVRFRGQWHDLPFVGLSLAPVQRPIPIWMAAANSPDKVLRRIGQLADGIIPLWDPNDEARAKLEKIHTYAKEAGRDPETIGFEPYIECGPRWQDNPHGLPAKLRSDEEMAADLKAWAEMGATHIEFKTRSAGFTSIDETIREMKRFKPIADSVLS